MSNIIYPSGLGIQINSISLTPTNNIMLTMARLFNKAEGVHYCFVHFQW